MKSSTDKTVTLQTPTDDVKPLGRPWTVVDDVELARLTERDRLLSALIDDMDGAVAAHHPEDPRHPSHGGQHTNGRCCPFGNLNPSAIGVFKRWVTEARGTEK